MKKNRKLFEIYIIKNCKNIYKHKNSCKKQKMLSPHNKPVVEPENRKLYFACLILI
jgi:hypothetical protein